jgi:hypothetical protein
MKKTHKGSLEKQNESDPGELIFIKEGIRIGLAQDIVNCGLV